MTPYEVVVMFFVVGLFIVISLLPFFTGKDDNSPVQPRE